MTSALAFSLLIVFSNVFKSPDGGTLFSAQLDPILVLLASVVACAVGVAAIPARMDPVQAIRA